MKSFVVNWFFLLVNILGDSQLFEVTIQLLKFNILFSVFIQFNEEVNAEPVPTHLLKHFLRKHKHHKYDDSSEEYDHRKHHSDENDDDYKFKYHPSPNPPVYILPPPPPPSPPVKIPPPETQIHPPPVYFPPNMIFPPGFPSQSSKYFSNIVYPCYQITTLYLGNL